MKVLLIDDDPSIRKIARIALETIGRAQFFEADSGPEGIRIAGKETPDVILLDVMLPGMDGPATLAQLRLDPATRGIPVIFLTALHSAADCEELKKLGAAAVLNKPFKAMTLSDNIKDILKKVGRQ